VIRVKLQHAEPLLKVMQGLFQAYQLLPLQLILFSKTINFELLSLVLQKQLLLLAFEYSDLLVLMFDLFILSYYLFIERYDTLVPVSQLELEFFHEFLQLPLRFLMGLDCLFLQSQLKRLFLQSRRIQLHR